MYKIMDTKNIKPIYKCQICQIYTEEKIHCGKPTILLLDPGKRVSLSKFLSGILRHYPYKIGVELTDEGYIKIDKLVKNITKTKRFEWVTREHIVAIALLDPKNRFEIKNSYIRANYGHSIKINIKYPVARYSGPLYHGTTLEKLKSILSEGLKPMKRNYVHLTTSLEDAYKRASVRNGKPVILVIDGKELSKHVSLYKATEKIYLTKYVPPKTIIKIIHK